MNYSTEDNEKALEVLTDLVNENIKLKGKLQEAHRFLLAQLLNSENGEIRFNDPRFNEDLDLLLGGLQLEIQSNSTLTINGIPEGSYLYAVQQLTVSNRRKLSKEDLENEFEVRRYKINENY